MDFSDIPIGDVDALASEIDRVNSQYANDPTLENAWALQAMENAEKHMELIESCDCKYLRLSNCDDQIYSHFRQKFPNLCVTFVDEESIKSDQMKAAWREFVEKFTNMVPDYNFGTLLRCDVKGQYDSMNTILVPKIQFLAIEIARNREGHNACMQA